MAYGAICNILNLFLIFNMILLKFIILISYLYPVSVTFNVNMQDQYLNGGNVYLAGADTLSLNSFGLFENEEIEAWDPNGIMMQDSDFDGVFSATLELDSNLQISGLVSDYFSLDDSIVYFQTTGPTQISYKDKQIANHGVDRHMEGFGSPLGSIENGGKINDLNIKEFNKMGYDKNQNITLQFRSGVKVEGIIKSFLEHNEKIQIITFENCTVKFNNQILFKPEWGEYDMVCGVELISVYGGVGDVEKFYEYKNIKDDRSLNQNIIVSNNDENLNKIYSRIREIREQEIDINVLKTLYEELSDNYPSDWLANLEIYELVKNQNYAWVKDLRKKIDSKTLNSSDLSTAIQKALLLI